MINLVGQIIDNEILKMEEGGAKDPASDYKWFPTLGSVSSG